MLWITGNGQRRDKETGKIERERERERERESAFKQERRKKGKVKVTFAVRMARQSHEGSTSRGGLYV